MTSFTETEAHLTSESYDAGKHGKDFEIELSKFLFKRVLDKNFIDFRITRERKGLGKFDDLALIYETNDNVKKFILIQFKHIQDETKVIDYNYLAENHKSYFLLKKYFNYFHESLRTIEHDPDFNGAHLDKLVICTNITFNNDLNPIKKKFIGNDFLFRGSGSLYKLEIPNKYKRQIFEDSYLSDTQKLANELVTFLVFNKQININALINDEHASLIKDYHVALATHVIDTNSKKLKQEFLDNQIKVPEVEEFRRYFLSAVHDFFFHIKDFTNENLEEKFKINSSKAVKLQGLLAKYENASSLVCFLKTQTINVSSNFGVCLDFAENKTLPYPTMKSAEETDELIDQFLTLLVFAVEQNNNETIIREEMAPEMLIAFNDTMNFWYHCGSYKVDDVKPTRKREWITKKKLCLQAMDSDIYFQGKLFKLKNVTDNKDTLNSDILMKTFCSKTVYVGKELPEFGDIRKFYISRTLMHSKVLGTEILKESKYDIFLLRNTDPSSKNDDNLLEIIPSFEILYDLDNFVKTSRFLSCGRGFGQCDFDNFVSYHYGDVSSRAVHWLDFDGNKLLWQASSKSVLNISKYVQCSYKDIQYVSEDALLTDSYKYFIISGEPGMGKTILFDHLTEILKERYSNKENPHWIMKIALKDCVEELNKMEHFRNLDNIIKFLLTMENTDDDFAKELLKYYMNKMQVILMLDGFDELSSESQQEKVIDIIKYLRINNKVKYIFVTTRPHFREKLEDCASVLSYSIKDIGREEQITFLTKFWRENSSINDEEILNCTKQIVHSFNESVHEKEKTFLGIPLQTHMFAVVFQDEFIDNKLIVPQSLNICSLFEKFLQTKYKIYLQKNVANYLPSGIKQGFMKSLDEIHQNFALYHGKFLSSNNLQRFLTANQAQNENDLLQVGIVYKVRENFHFVHKTFAEYLISKRLVDVSMNLHKYDKDYVTTQKLLEKIILRPGNEFLLYLFDHILAENFPVHKLVLHGELEQIKNLKEQCIESADSLGRKPLYYAIQYQHLSIIEWLLDNNASIDEKDSFLMKSFIDYIKESYQKNVTVNQVCNDTVASDRELKFLLIFLRNNATTHYNKELINIFKINLEMERKNWELVEVLIKNGYRVNISSKHEVPIIYALKHKAPLNIIHLLLEKVKRNKLTKEKLSDNYAYSYLVNYIFECDENDVVNMITEYKQVVYLCDFSPFHVVITIFFNLENIEGENSLINFLQALYSRSKRFTFIVKTLLEHGANYSRDSPQGKRPLDIFSDTLNDRSQYNRFIRKPVLKYLKDVPNLKAHTEEIKAVCQDLQRKYKEIVSENDDTTRNNFEFFESVLESITSLTLYLETEEEICSENLISLENLQMTVCEIAKAILRTSEGGELLRMVSCFFEEVKLSNVAKVNSILKKAKEKDWIRALMNARALENNINCNIDNLLNITEIRNKSLILNTVEKYRNNRKTLKKKFKKKLHL